MGRTEPLSTFAAQTENCDMNYVHSKHAHFNTGSASYSANWVWLLVVFIIIVIIIWCIIVFTCPDAFQKEDHYGKKTKEIDHGKALVAAIILALIICVILGFLYRGSRS